MTANETIYLSLGSNLGDRLSILYLALQRIAEIPGIQDFKASSFYETSPVSDIPQDYFLNAVCRFQTCLHPIELLKTLQLIERSLGKKTSEIKNAPREIDIDILFYGNQIYENTQHNIEIPHPRWRERLFVIVPLLDLTPMITLSIKQSGEEIIDLIKLKDSLTNKSQLINLYS